MYINCKTWFSFRYGTFSTEALVEAAADLGVASLALTNINNTCDAWDFVDFCRTHNIRPVLGAEIRNGSEFLYLLLARDNEGFRQINEFLGRHLQDGIPFPPRPRTDSHVFVVYPPGRVDPADLSEGEFIGVQHTELTGLFGIRLNDFPGRFVIRQPVTFADKTFYNVHRLLRAIDRNTLLSKQSPRDIAAPNEYFMAPAALMEKFAQYPSLITSTLQLLDACSIEMEFHTDKTKKLYSASADDDRQLLAKLAMDGLSYRYGSNSRQARDRVLRELEVINELGFNAYFLITWDIIRYARSRGFFYVGRGSGANSIVAYCLRITDVDPVGLDLYFERFLNPYRSSPPDFDIDFSWTDRDEMIDYIFKRYGSRHVALLGCYVTFQKRAVIRELGKVFGLPKEEIDKLERNHAAEDKIQKQILYYGELIRNFPNHVSIHAGGILISDEPLSAYAASFMPPKGFPVTQIDMFIAEKIGLFKLDILSQRGLGHIREATDIIRQNRHEHIDIHDVERFKRDPAVRAQIRTANTIGCFYIESPAMRQLLKKLRCDDYITLVAASSIIRPGVAQSGMMKEYIHRFHNPGSFEYLHPVMEELLKETYGVMVFQEDVIKVAHYFAGLDLGEADVLRRTMSGKYRSGDTFQQIREKFFVGCRERGHPDALSREVWRQMESFAGYSFNKAHSASFAVESFQSLYLKTYYPKEFLVAVINNFGGFYSRELYFLELRKTGAAIQAPCVNHSDYLTSIRGNDVFTGFVHMQSLEKEAVDKIIEERSRYGSYLHLQDFMERTAVSSASLDLLISIGALRFTGKSKKQLLWEARFLSQRAGERIAAGHALFADSPVSFTLPSFPVYPLDDRYDEMEILGFPLSNPFDLCIEDPFAHTQAASLENHCGEKVTMLLYYIDQKGVSAVNGRVMAFGTFMDARLDWVDTVHFPDSLSRYPLRGKGFYKVTGRVTEDFGVFSLEVSALAKVGYKSRKGTEQTES